jgi:hypothetical protein
MKKIFKQLLKLFGGTITIEHSINRYSADVKENYKIYIGHSDLYPYHWSPKFETLKELDKHLSEKIENYKRVYKD